MERAFCVLMAGPCPLAVDGAAIGFGLPPRPVPLDELAALLLDPGFDHAGRDAAWRVLLWRARRDPAWMVGAAGVALPMLRRLAGSLAHDRWDAAEDVDAAVLEAFVTAVHATNVSIRRIPLTLQRAVKAGALRARRREAGPMPVSVEVLEAAAPPPPWGHPDLLLLDAVDQRIITRFAAQVIGATRLENVPIGRLATALGISYWALAKYRRRAELALVRAIGDGQVQSQFVT